MLKRRRGSLESEYACSNLVSAPAKSPLFERRRAALNASLAGPVSESESEGCGLGGAASALDGGAGWAPACVAQSAQAATSPQPIRERVIESTSRFEMETRERIGGSRRRGCGGARGRRHR